MVPSQRQTLAASARNSVPPSLRGKGRAVWWRWEGVAVTAAELATVQKANVVERLWGGTPLRNHIAGGVL